MDQGLIIGGYMPAEAVTASAKYAVDRLHLRVVWLCGVVLFLEGYILRPLAMRYRRSLKRGGWLRQCLPRR